MGRGRLLKTKVKEEKALTKARLEGERQFWNQKKALAWKLRDTAIDFLKKNPIKVASYIACFFLVFNVIRGSREVTDALEVYAGFKIPPKIPTFDPRLPELKPIWQIWEERKGKLEGEKPGKLLWDICLSMVIAYFIIEHGGDIIKAFGGIAKTALFLLA